MGADTAARFSDAHATADPDAAARADRLAKLKARIGRDFPGQFHRYHAAWDVQAARVTGLEEFGQQVEEAIWAQLESELAEAAEPAELSWQEQEARLDEFAADRRRDFQGRTELLNDIAALCLAGADGADWALCLIGPPGTGKSAVFAELLARLQKRPLLCSPTPPAPARARPRWTPCCAMDGQTRRVPERAGRAGGQRRRRDGGTQLRQPARPRGGTATRGGAAGCAGAVRADPTRPFPDLASRAVAPERAPVCYRDPGRRLRGARTAIGGGSPTMPALTEAEARAVFAAIHERYHRTPDPAVLAALIQKPVAGWSNPLWLYLAVEQVNLLDGDDIARAERAHDQDDRLADGAAVAGVAVQSCGSVPDRPPAALQSPSTMRRGAFRLWPLLSWA